MHRQCKQSENADEDRKPVQDPGVFPKEEIGPQRLKEVAAGVQRDAANHVAERRSEKYGQQQTRCTEKKIPQGMPHCAVNVIPEFNRSPAKNQEPQDDYQREIESAEPA